jgi:D-beta-D-heptose 7-phosphate kinase/D-beta-D-heptose 1-phosphate adenosyltransferase
MNRFKDQSPKILVVGDLMIDHYLYGHCERISPEAPVQVVNIRQEKRQLGGAGNVVNNLITLGAQVKLVSVIGDDDAARQLIDLLTKIDIDTSHLFTQRDRKTTQKSRIIAAQQQIVRYDHETITAIDSDMETAVLNAIDRLLEDIDIVLLSDYGKGVLTDPLTRKILRVAGSANKKVLVDPKGQDYSKYQGAFLLTPNKKEASLATGIEITDQSSLQKAISQLKTDQQLAVSLITLSEQGIAILDDQLRIHPTQAREVYDVTGAGDTVLASLGFALACGANIDEAVDFANLAAGVVVGKMGSATASFSEIIEYQSSLNHSMSDDHIKTQDEMARLLVELKKRNKKIVFTNGCFDILHAGHVRYLETAKSFGDVLIVGLNSDASVKRLKGETRPINPEEDRAYLLAALEAVDYVVLFTEDTPLDLIKLIKPNILVKGGDYEGKHVVGQEIADELKLVQFVDGKSTTRTIEKIKTLDKQ